MTLKDCLRCAVASLLVTLFVCGLFQQNVHGADWKLLGKDTNDCQWFYDGANVKHLPERKVLVWMKRVVHGEQRKKEGSERLGFEMGLMELDCMARTIRQLSVNDYDQEGKYLKARKIGENVTPIVRSSMAEAVYQEVCALRGKEGGGVFSPFSSP